MKADITEIFSSVQGEGPFAGAKQIFVRFKACNLKCAWCDVPDFLPARECGVPGLMGEIKALEAKSGPHHSVSLTGGEPLVYCGFLREFTACLKEAGFKIYLETNGTLPEKLSEVIGSIDIVAMDFKLPSSTGERSFWKEHREFLKIARRSEVFVKAVVTDSTEDNDIEESAALLKAAGADIPFILQPVDPCGAVKEEISGEKLSHFLDILSKNGIRTARVMAQMHKISGVR